MNIKSIILFWVRERCNKVWFYKNFCYSMVLSSMPLMEEFRTKFFTKTPCRYMTLVETDGSGT